MAEVIITAANEEVRRCSMKSEKTTGRSGMDGQVKKHITFLFRRQLLMFSLKPEVNGEYNCFTNIM